MESKVRTSTEDATNLLMMKKVVKNLGTANFGVILTMTDIRNKTNAQALDYLDPVFVNTKFAFKPTTDRIFLFRGLQTNRNTLYDWIKGLLPSHSSAYIVHSIDQNADVLLI